MSDLILCDRRCECMCNSDWWIQSLKTIIRIINYYWKYLRFWSIVVNMHTVYNESGYQYFNNSVINFIGKSIDRLKSKELNKLSIFSKQTKCVFLLVFSEKSNNRSIHRFRLFDMAVACINAAYHNIFAASSIRSFNLSIIVIFIYL